jgi:glucose-6-phosphate isomerase
VVQNETSKSELIVALWRFGTNGNIGAMGRSHNYPESDQNLNAFLKWNTQLNMESKSNRVVELGSDEVFDHPFACISKPGGDVFDG